MTAVVVEGECRRRVEIPVRGRCRPRGPRWLRSMRTTGIGRHRAWRRNGRAQPSPRSTGRSGRLRGGRRLCGRGRRYDGGREHGAGDREARSHARPVFAMSEKRVETVVPRFTRWTARQALAYARRLDHEDVIVAGRMRDGRLGVRSSDLAREAANCLPCQGLRPPSRSGVLKQSSGRLIFDPRRPARSRFLAQRRQSSFVIVQ